MAGIGANDRDDLLKHVLFGLTAVERKLQSALDGWRHQHVGHLKRGVLRSRFARQFPIDEDELGAVRAPEMGEPDRRREKTAAQVLPAVNVKFALMGLADQRPEGLRSLLL